MKTDPRIKAIRILRTDFEQFCRQALKIKTKSGKLVSFEFNRAQKRFSDYLLKCLRTGVPIRCIVLKARQLGFSTIIAAFFYWLTSMNPHRGALVVAHDMDSSRNLFDKSKLFYKVCPPELRPMKKNSNRTEIYFANPDDDGPLGLESRILVETAGNEDLGASFTLHFVHLSEFARYEKVVDVKAMMTSLNQTIPNLPGTAKIIETTALGEGYFKDMWDEPNGYEKIFVSWVANEEYRIDGLDEVELTDVEDTDFGNEVLEAENIRKQILFWYPEWREKTPANAKLIDNEILCRIRWRRWAIKELCENDKQKFRQEYPTTPEDAFAVSGTGVFDQRMLSDIKTRVRAALAQKVIVPAHYRFAAKASDTRASNRQWWKRAFYNAPYGNLTVYEEPQEGQRYVIGADPSDGILEGGDNSAACVLKIGPVLKQVAQWKRPVEPDEFADLLYALGMIYNRALLGVEVENMGRATILRLAKDLFYGHLFFRKLQDEMSEKRQTKFGWYTTSITKPIMISAGQAAIKSGELILMDRDTIDEMMAYKRLADGSYGAPQGKKDDCCMSVLIAIQMAKQIHITQESPNRRPPRFSPEGIVRRMGRDNPIGRIGYSDLG